VKATVRDRTGLYEAADKNCDESQLICGTLLVSHLVLSLTIAFKIVSSFRALAMTATLLTLPEAFSRS
jgi:hypothetical protein